MPVKNGEKYLRRSLENLISTLGRSDEILIVNDFSTDSTKSIALEFCKNTTNVRLLDSTNQGLVNSLNFGLKNSQHKIIARVDVDDEYAGDRIDQQVNALEQNTVAVFSDYKFFTEGQENLGTMYSAIHPVATSLSLITSQRTAHPSVVFRRDAVLDVGGYRKEDFPAEDLSLWLRLSRVGHVRSVPSTLLKYRINPLGVSATRRNEMIQKKVSLIQNIGINPKDVSILISSIADIHEIYQSFPNCSERRILFARDLMKLSNIKPEYRVALREGLKLLGVELAKGQLLPIVLKFHLERARRSKIR